MNNDFCYGRDSYFIQEYGLKKPDKYILRVFRKAEYYLSTECWCLAFERVSDDLKDDLENYTIIKGKPYKSTFTNKYEELVKHYDLINKKKNFEEVNLF